MNQMAFPQREREDRRTRLAGYRAQVDGAIAECFAYGKDEPAYTADLKLRYRLAGARLVRTSLDLMKALESKTAESPGSDVGPAASGAEIKN